MPRDLVLRHFRDTVDRGQRKTPELFRDLAHGFGASKQAMEYRLENVGLFSPLLANADDGAAPRSKRST